MKNIIPKKRLNKSFVGICLLVLMATTVIRLYSLNDTLSYNEDDEKYSWESQDDLQRRRLGQTIEHPFQSTPGGSHVKFQETAEVIIQRTYDELKRHGHIPGSGRFNQLLHNKSQRRLAKIPFNTATVKKRTYRNLKKGGKLTPGTIPFNVELQRREKDFLQKQIKKRGLELEKKVHYNQEDVKEELVRTLKDTEDKWIRGNFLKRHKSNMHNRDEQIHEAEVRHTMSDESRRLVSDSLYKDAQDGVEAAIELSEQLSEGLSVDDDLNMLDALNSFEPMTICDRPTDVGTVEDFASFLNNAHCDEFIQEKPIVILANIEGEHLHGRTGNNLLEFLHAVQMARDNNIQLGIMTHSWAMTVLQKMWMSIESADWQAQFESAFCIKIFDFPSELEGWDARYNTTKELFYYESDTPLSEYIDTQEKALRTLFRNYNHGDGYDTYRLPTQDMCSGIRDIFGDGASTAIYSVIHSRHLEGLPGQRLLKKIARNSGCDPTAALNMEPEYVKSILRPLGMLNYPIVFISDGQDPTVLERLRADPEISHLLHTPSQSSSWLGGDITAAVMSSVFIGNPASSFSGFIAKSRLSLGFGHSYLFRGKDSNGEWRTVCGDSCVFDRNIYGVMA